jgi:hypothetical protein
MTSSVFIVIARFAADAAWLTAAGGEARYPGVEEPCDEAEARKALAIAETFKQFCIERMQTDAV